MNNKSVLAIVIPYFKLTFFERTLQSLAQQSNKNFNLYIGDDASPENPWALMEQFKAKFFFTYKRFEDNLGSHSLTKQWERCIELSGNEDWIMILGDDDMLGENVVEMFYKNLDIITQNSLVVRFASQVIYEDEKTVSPVHTHPMFESAAQSFYRRRLHQTRSGLSEYIFSRSSYEKYKFRDYPLASHSDDMAWLEFPCGKPIYSINEAIVYVGLSRFSITGRVDNLLQKNKAAYLFYIQAYKEKGVSFSKSQRIEILHKIELVAKQYRKLRGNEWFFLFKNYLYNFQLHPFTYFIRRFLKSILFPKNYYNHQ